MSGRDISFLEYTMKKGERKYFNNIMILFACIRYYRLCGSFETTRCGDFFLSDQFSPLEFSRVESSRSALNASTFECIHPNWPL